MSPSKRPAKTPPPPVPTPEEKTPMLRVALSPADFRALLDQLETWDHPIAHRLRMVYSRYRIKHPG